MCVSCLFVLFVCRFWLFLVLQLTVSQKVEVCVWFYRWWSLTDWSVVRSGTESSVGVPMLTLLSTYFWPHASSSGYKDTLSSSEGESVTESLVVQVNDVTSARRTSHCDIITVTSSPGAERLSGRQWMLQWHWNRKNHTYTRTTGQTEPWPGGPVGVFRVCLYRLMFSADVRLSDSGSLWFSCCLSVGVVRRRRRRSSLHAALISGLIN